MRPLEVLLGLLVLVGIVLVAGFERGRLAGLAVALLGALLAAVFPVLNRLVVAKAIDPLVMVGWEMVGAWLACLVCPADGSTARRLRRLLDLAGPRLAVAACCSPGPARFSPTPSTSTCCAISAPTPATSR